MTGRIVAALVAGLMLAVFLIAAPVLFGAVGTTLPDTSAAGELAGPMFFQLNVATLVGGVILCVVERGRGRRVALAVGVLALTLVEMGLITPKIESLRTELKREFGSVSTTPKEDKRRAAFGILHGVSTLRGGVVVILLGVLSTPLLIPTGRKRLET